MHLLRNVLAHAPAKHKDALKTSVQALLSMPNWKLARQAMQDLIDEFERIAPKSVKCLEEAFEDVMSVLHLPAAMRKKLRTTNMIERLNEEVRRRERVVRVFPNDESAYRLIGAVLADINDAWSERIYLNFGELWNTDLGAIDSDLNSVSAA